MRKKITITGRNLNFNLKGENLGMKLYTAKEIAPLVGTSEKRVKVLAAKRGIGQKVGNCGMWVFTASDRDKLIPGPNGRPRKT